MKESTTQRQTLIDPTSGQNGGHALVELESAYNVAVVGVS
jgi:hypothetical protein